MADGSCSKGLAEPATPWPGSHRVHEHKPSAVAHTKHPRGVQLSLTKSLHAQNRLWFGGFFSPAVSGVAVRGITSPHKPYLNYILRSFSL